VLRNELEDMLRVNLRTGKAGLEALPFHRSFAAALAS
jgi:hypothetical protein